ncbi:hypothetical protein EIKCOROL_02415 [Eikenella corrodens ATCC 23834]|uniref:Uncharacterized protein n=1 Tax=Eikenella corrodens ATCC 23834 TaxID=546274 RepID=C0DYF1_EIKCO|nr:hypothetical protein EIKCOROL_02415 [Eikenella corrodens ATCC 23834]
MFFTKSRGYLKNGRVTVMFDSYGVLTILVLYLGDAWYGKGLG